MPAAMKAPRMRMAPVTPQKRTVGCLAGSILKSAEEQEEDEEVVDRERLFDGVAGEILRGVLAAELEKDEDADGQGGCDPDHGCDDGG